jgi:cobalamin synthase
MSQVETTTPIKSTPTRKERVEAFLKSFEWTWTTAVVFSFVFVFFLLITTSVIPSFWLYFADQTLKWDGAAPQQLLFWNIDGYWLKELRDAVAMGLTTLPIIVALIGAAVMQNWRRKLRGQTGDVRPTGGYR